MRASLVDDSKEPKRRSPPQAAINEKPNRAVAIHVDPDTFAVRIDGELIEPAPAERLPMAQRYFLF